VTQRVANVVLFRASEVEGPMTVVTIRVTWECPADNLGAQSIAPQAGLGLAPRLRLPPGGCDDVERATMFAADVEEVKMPRVRTRRPVFRPLRADDQEGRKVAPATPPW
jgi:hypothetical protein